MEGPVSRAAAARDTGFFRPARVKNAPLVVDSGGPGGYNGFICESSDI